MHPSHAMELKPRADLTDSDSTIAVKLGRGAVAIDREAFEMLFENSTARHRVPIANAFEQGTIRFTDLVAASRAAEIPYALFFAPPNVVKSQVERKTNVLLGGISREVISLNSRSTIRLADVELIVKDLIQKQEELKRLESNLQPNRIIGLLRNRHGPVDSMAETLRNALGLDLARLRACKKKEDAFEYFVAVLEKNQVLVSQSQEHVMPQLLPRHARFSGLCVRHKRVPYLFLATGEGSHQYEPAGRRIMTLSLLSAMIATGRFAILTFDDLQGEPLEADEWSLAEALVMPKGDVEHLDVSNLDDVISIAEDFKVTPSALVMRLHTAGRIGWDEVQVYLGELRERWSHVPKTPARAPQRARAVRKYAGAEFVTRMFAHLDSGQLTTGEFRRIVTLNKLSRSELGDLREIR